MIVVTGGAGFIGSNMLAVLEAHGACDLVVVDHLGSGDKWRNIAKRELFAVVMPQQFSAFLDKNRASIEIMIHMGAVTSTMEVDADEILANNFSLSLALWEWCAANGVRLIYASSAATYGDGSSGFDDDFTSARALARLHPLNAYGWSKHLFDRWVWRRLASGGARPPQWAGLKFFNVYGPNEYHKGVQASVIAQIFPALTRGEPCLLFRSYDSAYPDGGQKRDFIHVNDCTDVILWLIDNPKVSGLFNVGTGQARTFYDLALAVYRVLDQKPCIRFIDTPVKIRDKYQYFTQARVDRLRAAGYEKPFTMLEDGVTHYIKTYLTAGDRYR